MASIAHIYHLFLFFSLILAAYHTISAANVSVGESLVAKNDASPAWLSPSGDFAFGFSQLDNADTFLLSIYYAKIPEKTVVWCATTSFEPVIVPQGSTLEIVADQGFALNDPGGRNLWNPDNIVTGTVAYGFMEDTGNFVLKSKDSETLWESFKNPTNTILPAQNISTLNRVVLSSTQSATNFSQGRFQLFLQLNGSLGLRTVNLPSTQGNEPYFTFPDSAPFGSLSFNDTGYLNVLVGNGTAVALTDGTTLSAKDYYLRATLEFDGLFIQYTYPKANSSDAKWNPIWLVPDDICMRSFVSAGSGVCGFNRICRLDVNHRPVCECPRGFSLLDQEDEYRSCIPDFSQGCQEGAQSSAADAFVLEEISNIDWPTSDYELLAPFQEDDCKDSCLNDCMCAVAIFRGGNLCWKKKIPLSNGRIDANLNGKAFIKTRKYGTPQSPDLPKSSGANSKDTLILAGSVLLGSSVFVNFILIGAIALGFFLIYQKKLIKLFRDKSGLDVSVPSFTYKELEDATDSFKQELGRGSFGIVYKGVFNNGDLKTSVAVKKLDRLLQENEREFITEVLVIGQTHHKNLVRLLGYCNEGQNRLLVYEFLSNGTLASFLFEDLKPSWEQRTRTALGIGRGLLYLHEECSTQIIHCDIKPQNILLDEDYEAKISDFGLAKLLLLNQSHTHTAIRGTRGYVAPEWFRNTPITVKVDVYSFGILLLEIICCRRSIDIEAGSEEKVILADWAYDCYRAGMLGALVKDDEDAVNDIKTLERFVMVAIWCIQEDPSVRPIMKKVMLMLEGIIQVPTPPCPFAFGYSNITLTSETSAFSDQKTC